MYITFERIGEDYEVETAPMNDIDGKITGKVIIGLREWFEENPEERIRMGWIKHIHRTEEELGVEYNPLSQFTVKSYKWIDENTIEDTYAVRDMSEEMMLLRDMISAIGLPGNNVGGIVFIEG